MRLTATAPGLFIVSFSVRSAEGVLADMLARWLRAGCCVRRGTGDEPLDPPDPFSEYSMLEWDLDLKPDRADPGCDPGPGVDGVRVPYMPEAALGMGRTSGGGRGGGRGVSVCGVCGGRAG